MRVSLYALAGTLCFAAICQVSRADTLTFNGASGPVETAASATEGPEGVYTYPYNFSVNGSSANTALMCISFDNAITNGESWNVNVETIAQASANTTELKQYEEDAWLFSQMNSTNVANVQFAVWAVGDPTVASSVDPYYVANQLAIDTLLSDASSAVAGVPPSAFSNYVLYVPADGSYTSADGYPYGVPQTFIGDAPTPEPGSLALLGTGLLGMGGVVRRKMRRA